jgi:hypothetical protein
VPLVVAAASLRLVVAEPRAHFVARAFAPTPPIVAAVIIVIPAVISHVKHLL